VVSQAAAIANPLIGAGAKGKFLGSSNEIVFVEGRRCIKTTLHETLHATSSFTQLEEAKHLEFLFEGLTECLTGYLLYRAYPYSYSNCWKAGNPQLCCSIAYEPYCRLWGSFFHFVPIRTIIPLCFELPPDWNRMCHRFVNSVRQSGYTAFVDVLNLALSAVRQQRSLPEHVFRNECGNVFRKKFKVYCGTPVALDFSTIKHSCRQ